MAPTPVALSESDNALNDLGPLAWVLEELRKSLDGATKAMHRFVRDAELARGSELGELDASHLRVARQQLHQAVGALEMVGLPAPARLLQAMESAVQKFVQRPELCSDEAASRIERASFALTEYLEGLIKGKSASSVALFPQYRAVLELAGAERIHPADLWPMEWRWLEVELPGAAPVLGYTPKLRAHLDYAVLRAVKSADPRAGARLALVCDGLSAGSQQPNERSFWAVAAGFFDAMGQSLLRADVYTKRTASRVLQQYALLARGGAAPSERLAQDLLFFCAHAVPRQPGALQAVRQAYGLSETPKADYATEQFGRFDPAQLQLARRRIAAAAETWSALAGGDTNRLRQAGEQFAAMAESIVKLHPQSDVLAQALQAVMDATLRAAAAPPPGVAMEVATAVLYLEAAYQDLDPTDDQMSERSARLAQRLRQVLQGAEPEPLEGWMEELYRRVSERQTMGSVVDELRAALGEVEVALDQFFRNPADKAPLREVPNRLSQMRGVFSVLGLEQPALATLRMRANVDNFIVDPVEPASARAVFEKLGNSLGALGLLIDMLGYQRALAKKLFVYDDEAGEFRPLMGRQRSLPGGQPGSEDAAATAAAPLQEPAGAVFGSVEAAVPPPRAGSQADEEDEGELLDIFLEEARQVVQTGLQAADALAADPSNLAEQTTLRRSFHTLKGSSRMVGLADLGESAWAFEQLFNAWLAEPQPASEALITLAREGMTAFGRWVEDLSGQTGAAWNAADFRASADALRLQGRYLPLPLPAALSEADQDGFANTSMSGALDFEPSLAQHEFTATQIEALPPDLQDAVPPVDPTAVELPQIPLEAQAFAPTHLPEFEVTQVEQSRAAPEAPSLQSVEVVDLVDFDFGGVFDTAAPAVAAPPGPEPAPAHGLVAPDAPGPDAPELLAAEPEPEQEQEQEQFKVIGDLRLSIPFYNVFLNEADEWSRRLQVELSEWGMELPNPMADSTVGLAHSLGGIAATVGFGALAEVSRALERALEHVKLHEAGTSEHAPVFNAAAEEIRRLLHQFAAGFLKSSDPALLQALRTIETSEFAPPALQDDIDTVDAAALDPWLQDPPLQPEPAAWQAPDAALAPPQPAPLGQTLAPPDAAVAHALLEDSMLLGDVQDHLDADLFPIFQEEAQELMPALGGALRQWVAQPELLSARGDALRALHTLKGSARLAGALRLGDMAHHLESRIEALGSDGLTTGLLEPLMALMDALQTNLDALALAPREDVSQAGTEPASSEDHAAGVAQAAAAAAPHALTPVPVLPGLSPIARIRPAGADQLTRHSPRGTTVQTVRVRSQLLDRMVNQAGEMMISRSRLDARVVQMRSVLSELTGNLDRLRQQLRDVEVQAESQMQSRMAHAKDDGQAFDPLEFDRFTRVQELTRMMAESVNDVATVQRNLQRAVEGAEDDLNAQGRQARELQRDLLRTRMVEFESIAERLYGVVRQASKESGKTVRLDIVGGSIEMDRGVLDRMTPSFEHLLRNAVVHGIEEGSVRAQAGKSAGGNITVTVHQEGNDVSVSFSDDGGGLQLARIRAQAVANGLIAPDQQLSDAEAAQLVFRPGFSTATEVTELAGRGIGMDVVLTELNALGGQVETHSEEGRGTTFRLVLPLTTAVTQVVMLRMGELSFGVPTNLVETVLRAPAPAVQAAYAQGSFRWNDQDLPFYWGGALLQLSGHSTETPGHSLPVAVLRSAGQRLALHVDEVLGNREVVVKNLGPQLAQLPGLAGMSVLASGAVVLIYNPVALATVYGSSARALMDGPRQPVNSREPQAALAAAPVLQAQAPLVLVVDDSITVRRVTQRLLKREGYRVALANDGLHALEVLAHEKPVVVLSDIEMPRMDGFDLVRNIRIDQALKDLPVIMITSRIAQKHRDHALELGVDHYLGKPYSEDELLALIRSYCVEEQES